MKKILLINALCFLFTFVNGQCEDKSNNWTESWTSCTISANPNSARADSHWILYEFDEPHYLTETFVWNANRVGESGNGLKDVIFDISLDGSTWTELGTYTFSRGTELDDYQGFEGPNLGNNFIHKVLITVISTHDGGTCASLGEILFRVDNTRCHGVVDDCGVCDGPGAATWYIDADGDGLGSNVSTIVSCDQPFGYVDNDADVCDSGELGWQEIGPLFETSCNGCHVQASAGGLSLATYEGFLNGGNSCGTSLKTGGNLVGIITVPGYDGCGTAISQPAMNLRTGSPLAQDDLDKIQRWIDGGAPESCVDFCIEDEVVTSVYEAGSVDYRQASNEIISTSAIKGMTRIFFDAGQNIMLEPSFEVLTGGEFIAQIGGCN